GNPSRRGSTRINADRKGTANARGGVKLMRHTCPGCGAATRPIVLALYPVGMIGYAPPGPIPYSEPGAQRSIWTWMPTPAGTVQAEVCPECDLVSWFAQSHGGNLPRPSDAPAPERA